MLLGLSFLLFSFSQGLIDEKYAKPLGGSCGFIALLVLTNILAAIINNKRIKKRISQIVINKGFGVG